MNNAQIAVLGFMALGIALGYAIGVARTASRYAKEAKAESSDVLGRLETLIAKIKTASGVRDQEMSDMSDRIDVQEERHE